MNRLHALALLLTFAALVATSRAPNRCHPQALALSAQTTCTQADLTVTADVGCQVTVTPPAAGLPTQGRLVTGLEDGGFEDGFNLATYDGNTGLTSQSCAALPTDGGFVLTCYDCQQPADGGNSECDAGCSGTLLFR